MPYINPDKIPIDDVVENLYNFDSIGALSLDGVLTTTGINELNSFARTYNELTKVKEMQGKVRQDMRTKYFYDIDEHTFSPQEFLPLQKFVDEYSLIYSEIAKKANFNGTSFNALGIHHYGENSQGITPHQDFSTDRDLISIFILIGQDPLYVCLDRKKNGSIALAQNPGSLVLLRAARQESEQKYRPIHYLNPVTSERYTLIVRKCDLQKNSKKY
ncbi:hypothetical protein J4456_02175 [Candidatus Pacearchaeota archaeon]|nr:hypothetical protein [Candidatus Pacearchaeota archaeon]